MDENKSEIDDKSLDEENILNRLHELELAREQDDIENYSENLFKNDKFDEKNFNANFEASRKSNALIKVIDKPQNNMDTNFNTFSSIEDTDLNNNMFSNYNDNDSFIRMKKVNKKRLKKFSIKIMIIKYQKIMMKYLRKG